MSRNYFPTSFLFTSNSATKARKVYYKMAPKRTIDESSEGPPPKKQRGGFKVGPDNLPDGTWRRKGIHKYGRGGE